MGNGGSLLSEPFYGDQIDKHAIVLRMNQVSKINFDVSSLRVWVPVFARPDDLLFIHTVGCIRSGGES